MSWIDSLVNERSSPIQRHTAWIGQVEFMAAQEVDSTGRTVKLRLIGVPEDQGKAHPFSKFTRKRRGKAGSRFEASFAAIEGDQQLMLEVMLLNWQSNPQGDTVVFLLNQESAQHPFMGCTRGGKDAPGTRWMVVAVEIDDSQELVQQGKTEQLEQTRRSGREQHLSNAARLLTKNPTFWQFLSEGVDGSGGDWTTTRADEWLKNIVGINSKAELDSDAPESVEKIVAFHRLRQGFVDFQERNGIQE